MKYARSFLAVGLLLLFVSPGHALSGNDLLERCGGYTGDSESYTATTLQKATDFGLCMGYITGMYDTIYKSPSLGGSCIKIPDGVTYAQVNAVVIRWLKDHPEDRQKDAADLGYLAIARAWPCPQ